MWCARWTTALVKKWLDTLEAEAEVELNLRANDCRCVHVE